ncbi:MAG: hypothetical protein IJW59_02585 [Clostridia bacterium]|nr:hypothetical protein [Clostridia bacterium]
MAEKNKKTKDMVIAIFCTILAVLCIVFYFLPAFNIKHSTGGLGADAETINYSAWEMTIAVFARMKVLDANWVGLVYIKEVYGLAVMLGGLLTPLTIISAVATAVFAYLSWLKGEQFKKYVFLFGLLCMIFQTIALIAVWFIAIQSREGNNYNFFSHNIKGGMSYGAFVSLILAFVIAIIACAYNYFLDNFDDEDDEEYDDEDEDDDDYEYEEVVVRRRVKKSTNSDDEEKSSSQKVEKPESTGGEKFVKPKSSPSKK